MPILIYPIALGRFLARLGDGPVYSRSLVVLAILRPDILWRRISWKSEMDEEYLLALDQGTTSSRALLFGRDGSIVGLAQKELSQYYPHPGWVEHDASEIWSDQLTVIRKAISDAKIEAYQIAAIGLTNQRETSLVWDRSTGQPIARAIVWQDRRTTELCSRLQSEGHERLIRERTGLYLDPYFSGSKLSWMLSHIDGLRQRAEAGELLFGTIDAWLVWNLTGGAVHVTDVTNASRTMLFNIHTLMWDEQLLELLDIPRQLLPEVRSSSEVYGTTHEDVLPGSIPIAGMAGDQSAALFGQACFEPGMAKNTYGTGCFLLMNTGSDAVLSQNNLLTTIAWQVDGETDYALEGSVFVAGAVVQWLRDGLGIIQSAPECDSLAAEVEDSEGVYFVPAFVGLGAPYWDPLARGTILGLTRGTGPAHLCRAALDSIALQTSELVQAMNADAGFSLKELRVDGGASQSNLLLQIQSNLEQSDVVRPKSIETTATGAAYLAGLAVGFWQSKAEIANQWQEERRFQPACSAPEARRQLARWQEAVQRSRHWADSSDEYGG